VVAQPDALAAAQAQEDPGTSLSFLELLTLLIFSPLGLVGLGILLIGGALCLWVAYMLGQRAMPRPAPPGPEILNQPIPEDFALQPKKEVPASKV
jgi:hypothetical protein